MIVFCDAIHIGQCDLFTASSDQAFVDAVWTSAYRGFNGLFRWPGGDLVATAHIDSAAAMFYLELALAEDPVILRGSDGTDGGDPIGALCEALVPSKVTTEQST